MKKYNWLLLVAILISGSARAQVQNTAGSRTLKGKIICVDPGHGGTATTDSYRVGKLGEREEWVNLRVALLLKEMLEKKGAVVILTRRADDTVGLDTRALIARDKKADAFISIHHNATADSSVNFPIIYFHGAGSENPAGVALATDVAKAFRKYFWPTSTPVSVVSDYTIFPVKGAAVLRGTYGIPGLLAEASFFTNEAEEGRLKQAEHNRREATAFANALEIFFMKPVPPVKEKRIPLQLPVFSVLQEADRMNPTALLWMEDFNKGKMLAHKKDTTSLRLAYDLFTRSARSFPDSYVAKQCHEYRSEILAKRGREKEAKEEKIRAREFYISF